MRNKRTLFAFLSLLMAGTMSAQLPISLDSCRRLAIQNNKELKIADAKKVAAHYNRKSAFTNYLPKVNAMGAYVRTEKEISLLNDEQKLKLNNLGTVVSSVLPQYAPMAATINGVGAGIVDALHTDTRDVTALSVMLTQPIFMGGKIIAYNKITKYAEQIAGNAYDLELQNVIVDVDETYWKIVQLQSKRKLAVSYKELIEKLDKDVENMISEGVATKADGLSVKVKLNEAEVTIIQIDNGLALLRMNLCQLCGLEPTEQIVLADENAEILPVEDVTTVADVQTALNNRAELSSLELATNIYNEKVKIARAEHLPTLALTGGYLATNPSLYNGFERKLKGMWNVGVVLKVPIITWGDRIYKVKAAKAEAKAAQYHYEEIREKVGLQVKQCEQKLQEARERMDVAKKSQDQADENLRLANCGLQEGVIPLSNVLAAQTAWLSARSTFITAQIDMKLADLYLRKSLGTLSSK